MSVVRDDITLVDNGVPTMFDMNEIRSKAAEAAKRLHERLS